MGKAGKLDLEMKEILRRFEQAEKDTRSLGAHRSQAGRCQILRKAQKPQAGAHGKDGAEKIRLSC